MCGITGFAERNHKAETARRIVKGMADLITYRGPDGEGYYVDDQVALGHRRLSIIDLEGGKQPMFNEDGSLVCIFNGEIYNFQTLREELIAAGHTFATRSDTEVLLHGYEQWGNQLPGKLRGMFTFVIWDQKPKPCLVRGISSVSNRSIIIIRMVCSCLAARSKAFWLIPVSKGTKRGTPAGIFEH